MIGHYTQKIYKDATKETKVLQLINEFSKATVQDSSPHRNPYDYIPLTTKNYQEKLRQQSVPLFKKNKILSNKLIQGKNTHVLMENRTTLEKRN